MNVQKKKNIQMIFILFFTTITILLLVFISNIIFFQCISLIGSIVMLIWLSWQISYVIRWNLIPNPITNPQNRAVLISGCDSGFGYELALQLRRDHNCNVFATVLDQNSYNANLLKSLGCIVIQMNVLSTNDIVKAYETVLKECQQEKLQLWAVVNNAGIIVSGEIEWGELDQQLQNVININVLGYVRVTRQFLPLIKQSNGRIINVSSVSSLFTAPGMVYYSMSKCAVSSFNDGLRRELYHSGIDVIEIIPDAYKTSMTSKIMLDNLDKCWNSSDSDIKKSIGDQYYQSFRKYIEHNLNVARDKPQEVVNALIHAISAKNVKYQYLCCGYINYIIIWSFSWMPLEWLEPIVTLFTPKDKPIWIKEE